MRISPHWKARLAAAVVASSLMASAAPICRAEDSAKEPATPSTQPAGAPGEQILLPEVNVRDVQLPDLIDFLRDVDPTFQAVIAYDPGAKRGEPTIQEMRLKNVSAEAVLELLSQTYPRITIQMLSGDKAAKHKIWTIRVGPDPRDPNGRGLPGEEGGLFGGAPDGQQTPVTAVHRLREIVDDIAPPNGGAAERKTALESIVSLVQATLETSGGRPGKVDRKGDVLLKLHEGTETLIFHGSGQQAMLVAQALETLAPRPIDADAATKLNIRQLSADLRRLQQQVATLQQSAGGHGGPGGFAGSPDGGPPGGVPGQVHEPTPGGATPPGRPADGRR
jgi:hypothetical protein